MVYHIARAGRQVGVFTEEEIRTGLAVGRFHTSDLFWAEGMTDWQPVGMRFSPSGPAPALPAAGSVNPYAAPQSRVLSNLAVHQPAPRSTRLAAYFLDLLTGLVGCGLPGMGAVLFLAAHDASRPNDAPAVVIVCLLLSGLVFLALTVWNIVLLTTRGQTLGKKWFGIRIVTFPDGQKPGFVKGFLLRSFVNGIIAQVVPFYAIIDPCFIFRDDQRCVHDLLADTTVIEGQPPEG